VLFKVNSSSFAFQTHLPIVQRPTSLERHASEQTFSKLLKSVGPKICLHFVFSAEWWRHISKNSSTNAVLSVLYPRTISYRVGIDEK